MCSNIDNEGPLQKVVATSERVDALVQQDVLLLKIDVEVRCAAQCCRELAVAVCAVPANQLQALLPSRGPAMPWVSGRLLCQQLLRRSAVLLAAAGLPCAAPTWPLSGLAGAHRLGRAPAEGASCAGL